MTITSTLEHNTFLRDMISMLVFLIWSHTHKFPPSTGPIWLGKMLEYFWMRKNLVLQYKNWLKKWPQTLDFERNKMTCHVDEGVKKGVIKSNMLVLLLFLGGIIIFIAFEKTKTWSFLETVKVSAHQWHFHITVYFSDCLSIEFHGVKFDLTLLSESS